MISKRAQLLKPSATLAMANRARDLQAAGQDVVSLTVGEPDWATFEVANTAGIDAIQKGFTKYTAAHGILELRNEVAKKSSEQLGVSYSANDVVIGCGAKYILFSALMMLLDPQDEVLIPSPYWVSYPTMVELAGGIPRIIECDKSVHFKLTAELLRKSIQPQSKVLILCSPSNPTGLQYSKGELIEIAKVLNEFPKLIVISDDIYNRLIFSEESIAPELLNVAPELKDRVFVVNGVSKTYSMTGWRIGWGLGPKSLIQPLADFLSQTTSSVSSISQKAALAALQGGESELIVARKNLQSKKEKFLQGFRNIRGMIVYPPDGAFYLWIDIKEFFGKVHRKSQIKIENSKTFSEVLLNHHLVATVPGVEFGAEGYLRLSFVTAEKNLDKAIVRFQDMSKEVFG